MSNETLYMPITLGRINKVSSFVDSKDNVKKILKCYTNQKNKNAELISLKILENNKFNIPKIYSSENDVVMEFIESDTNSNTNLIYSELERMKLITNDKFGIDHITFSGLDEVCNTFSDTWSTFFKTNRWLPLFNSLRKDNIEFESDYCMILLTKYLMIKILFQHYCMVI